MSMAKVAAMTNSMRYQAIRVVGSTNTEILMRVGPLNKLRLGLAMGAYGNLRLFRAAIDCRAWFLIVRACSSRAWAY